MSLSFENYVLASILLMTLATYAIRLLPFIILGKLSEHPQLVFIGKYLPPAMMVTLVIYCLKDTQVGIRPYGIPELGGVATVVLFQLWRRNALLSIFLGTSLYLFLSRF